MKASELRIGNWIYDDDGILCRVIGLSPYDHSVRCDEVEGCNVLIDIYPPNGNIKSGWETDLNRAEPIPTTEEWLLKFGFRNETDLIFVRGHIDSSYVLTHRSKGKFKDGGYFMGIRYDDWYVSETSHTEIHNFSFDVKYIHQLQNLYFALTGEELIIKK